MKTLLDVLVVAHFLGLAALLGGFLTQMSTRPRVINGAILWGAVTQLVTGFAMVALFDGVKVEEGESTNSAVIGIKTLLLLVITVLAVVNRKKESISTGVWATIGGLTLVNIVIAVFVGATKVAS